MIRHLKLAHRIALLPALAGLAFLLILALARVAEVRTQRLLHQIETGYAPALELGRDLEELLAAIQRGLQDAVAAAEPEQLAETDRRRDQLLARLEQGRAISTLASSDLEALRGNVAAYYALARGASARMIAGETGLALAGDLELLRRDYNALHAAVRGFAERQRQDMQRASAEARSGHRRSMHGIVGVTAGCLLLLGGLSMRVIRALNAELAEAGRVADALAEGEPAAVGKVSADEIGHLLTRMARMAERIVERTGQLRHEVAERVRAEAALRASEERYALAARGANDGLWDWDLITDRVYYSPRWLAMLGFHESQKKERLGDWLDRVDPEDLPTLRQQLDLHRDGVIPHFENEHRVLHRDGSYRWVLARGLAVRDANGVCTRIAGSLTDVTERKRTEQQLLHDAFHDALTGLANRALFLDRLAQALRVVAKRSDRLFAVLFLDLDRFKVINDSLGHLTGDQLLKIVAQRLETCMRPEDTVARLGGDEFAILLAAIDEPSAAVRVAKRVQREISQPCLVGHSEVVTTASIGIALSATGYQSPEEVLRDADIAMYRAKAHGKACHEVFDTAMHERSLAQLRLELDLRRALERRELALYYQPIVDLGQRRVVAFEALLRWRHPERGLVLPEAFIATAEETGSILALGGWVLEEACRQLAEWHRELPSARALAVAVNLSARQLAEPDLPNRVGALLAATHLPAGSLHLELTESVLMVDPEAAVQTLLRLKALGVHLAVDDFGTGYSSLSYLDRLPLDALKIDRSFVERLGRGDPELVRTILALGQNLDLRVVAEGVERADDARRLVRLGCRLAQGYLFSPPLPADQVPAFLDLATNRRAERHAAAGSSRGARRRSGVADRSSR